MRGEARERAILDATTELVGEVGYQALTVDAVAARAHASKATIYRRWRNKAELVKAALDAYDAEFNLVIPDTGELRGDLVAVLEALRDKATDRYLALLNALISAAKYDPVLAAALHEHQADDELSPFTACLQRAVARGEAPAEVDTTLVHDVAEALIMRQLTVDLPFDDAFINRVVDRVLLPLIRS
ncbi:TetR/AcrR family transcriptional regulator [Goodfellowiella coeruleoviolacea]|uniref:Transcriptional regulator, TetR family n=1 Tax=Goodfellowiella coeruleoviolacea TaxID=334858 RepID=A0AAE3GGN9_9PSEU|nr:TetR/AcrR family transcriptional regulator [Goodfellowiella coeruleoviolacea]MCP2167343.1 transcriptional regulator, TetR family [Goodfellowiella coeruleoviolacea]